MTKLVELDVAVKAVQATCDSRCAKGCDTCEATMDALRSLPAFEPDITKLAQMLRKRLLDSPQGDCTRAEILAECEGHVRAIVDAAVGGKG